ncbi:MAG: SH3 domain-containing protein [Lachnospiraceae bacterium]
MKKKKSWKRGLAAVLGLVLSIQAPVGGIIPALTAYAYTERTATVNASTLNVRSGPGTSNSQVAKLAKGTAVTVIGETTASDGKLWYQIRFSQSGGETTGYALSTYIRFPVSYTHDSDFEAYLTAQGFPDSYKDGLRELHAQYPNWVFVAQQTNLDWNIVIENQSVVGRNLVHKDSISSYKSIADGAYNWDTSSWPGFDGSTWVAASEDVIRYYIDPRNFLDDVYVFQFLSQQYDASIHTRDSLEGMLKGTFMEYQAPASSGSGGSSESQTDSATESGASDSGQTTSNVIVAPSGNSSTAGSSEPASGQDNVSLEAPQASISKNNAALVTSSYGPGVVGVGPGGSGSDNDSSGSDNNSDSTGSTTSYTDIIMNAAAQSGVNPYVLAAMLIQEQGRQGNSALISGTHSGYPGYYNYFNVGAYQDGNMSAVERGLWYASQEGNYSRPWNSPEKAIVGGAQFYGSNYVSAGQDTFYLKKYNVQGSNMYKHQYMTNVDGAASEASMFAEAYTQTLRNTALQFKIPVYTNMPASPCVKPTGTGSPNNKLRDLTAEGFTLTPTYNKDQVSYDLIVDHSVSNVTVNANAIDSTASISGTGNIQLQSGNNDITISVTAQNGSVRQYVIHVVKQDNGPTYSGGSGGGTADPQTTDTSGSTSESGPGAGSDSAPTPGGDNVVVISPAD